MDAVLLGEPLPVELMNARHATESGIKYDYVGDDAGAGQWLTAVWHRLPPASAWESSPFVKSPGSDVEHKPGTGKQLRELRDALRVLAAETTGHPQDPALLSHLSRREAVDTVNRISGTAHAWDELVWPTTGPVTSGLGSEADPDDLAVALIAREAVELFSGPARAKLRACLAPDCDRFFVKKHPRREWCSSACGNRARVARHYRRHHSAAAKAEGGTGRWSILRER